MTLRFVLLNESTRTDASAGGELTPAILAQMAAALEVQLNRDLAAHWGGTYDVRAAANVADIQPGEVVCAILDTMPDTPGAVAYHDVDGNELPTVYLGRDQCSSLIVGIGSVSSAMSHELCETAVDAFCNAWRDNLAGREYAQEACDAVQEWGYSVDAVSVSDFVLPAFFAPGSAPPYNYLGTVGTVALAAPFETAPGGYQIVRGSGTGETQVQGHVAAHRLARKRHWSSRSYRRGARV